MTLVQQPTETVEQYVARLQAALAVKPSVSRISFKASEKGGLSVYGMGRFPVTLYKEQWRKLSELMPDILAFITTDEASNTPLLKSKGE